MADTGRLCVKTMFSIINRKWTDSDALTAKRLMQWWFLPLTASFQNPDPAYLWLLGVTVVKSIKPEPRRVW